MADFVAVLGASNKEDRYSNKVIKLLKDSGYKVIPVHPTLDSVEGFPAVKGLGEIGEKVHTLTVYVNPRIGMQYSDDIISLKPGRVILNPGTESVELEDKLSGAGIPVVKACSLVLLKTGQFERVL